MDKIVCIKKYLSQGLQYELTQYKVYDSLHRNYIPNDCFLIINDRGVKEYYSKSDFMTLSEFRENNLNLIIDGE